MGIVKAGRGYVLNFNRVGALYGIRISCYD